MFKATTLSISAAVLLFAANVAHADEMKAMGSINEQQEMGSAKMQTHKAHGIVKKVNEAAGMVNITHDAIPSLKWSKMTMDFTVKDKAGLAAIKPGMAVDFEISMQGRNYHISHIEPAK